MTDTQTQGQTSPRFARKKTFIILTGSLFLIAATAFAAFFFSTAPITGSATTADAPAITWTGTAGATTVEGTADCSATLADGVLNIGATGVSPGTVCEYRAQIVNNGTQARLLGSSVGTDDPAITSWMSDACGQSQATGNGVVREYRVYVEFTDDLQPGQTVDLTGGVEWIASSEYDESLCLQ